MTVAVQLFVQLTLSLCGWLFIQDGALAREDGGEYKIVCEKGMPPYTAQSPYPYPTVYIDDGIVHGKYLCDASTDLGGWIIIQRRTDGKVSFDKEWYTYKLGFGKISTDYWMGLRDIYQFTSNGKYELRVDLKKKGAEPAFAQYSSFSISSEADNYKLHLGSYVNGTAGDAFRSHDGKAFSTSDRDNDEKQGRRDNNGKQGMGGRQGRGPYSGNNLDKGIGGSKVNCAVINKGGWWFHDCDDAYLNGPWYKKQDNEGHIEWSSSGGVGYLHDGDVLELTEMKIRRTQ